MPAPEAMRYAVREQAPAVTLVALATAALFLPAAVMGAGAGLELLHPFAIALLGGLISAVVVVLFVVPGIYPALAGLERAPEELNLTTGEEPAAETAAGGGGGDRGATGPGDRSAG